MISMSLIYVFNFVIALLILAVQPAAVERVPVRRREDHSR